MENEADTIQSNIAKSSQQLLEEAVVYFRARPGFKRLLDALVEKYIQLGRFGGTIVLENVSAEEREMFEGFFRVKLPAGTLRLKVASFEQALNQTKFYGLPLLGFLTAWYGGNLVTRAAYQGKIEQEKQLVLQRLIEENPGPVCRQWLAAIFAKHPGTGQIQRALADHEFYENMTIALQALAALPQTYQRFPIFARKICGDPHGLDKGRSAGKLFLEGLRYHRNWEREGNWVKNTDEFSAAEELNELLYRFNLLRDDLLNFATCFGLAAYEAGQEITYWRTAAESGAPLNVPLREIVRVTAFYSWDGRRVASIAQPKNFDVYVVENSNIFSAILDEVVSDHPQLVCLHGQFKLASWALLDRLIQSGALIHYSGDFDPEGLQIADKLLKRYPGRVFLWRMTGSDYLTAMPSVPLIEFRLNKLKLVSSPELEQLANLIARKGLAAYQEGIVDQLVQDIRGKSSQFL
ncbi:MAG TPA: TIGR02679 family protein [Firmicutes bacterium]|jgi:uncharacterized protein (TIGR02679 family)|nr:TIGR02679 family protein [Bacillota bacterium]